MNWHVAGEGGRDIYEVAAEDVIRRADTTVRRQG